MSRILYLVRHAEAESRQPNQTDRERVLNNQGKQQAIHTGGFLKYIKSNINLIITSPANRALSTANLIANHINFETNNIVTDERIYSSCKNEILKLISPVNESVTEILLVGHYPTIVELYNYLVSNGEISTMNTSELYSLKFEIPWLEITGGSGLPGTTFSSHTM